MGFILRNRNNLPLPWRKKPKQVYGVEIIKEAIDDARRNAALNHMDNVEFFVGKAEEVVPAQYEKTGIHPDVIVVDPPRKGCDADTLKHNARYGTGSALSM